MSIVTVGLSHQTSPVELRERFAIGESHLTEAMQRLRSEALVAESVILSTCNRVEIYAATSAEAERTHEAIRGCLARIKDVQEPTEGIFYEYGARESVEHLFRVACGMESLVLGETEILGQLKNAYKVALESGHTGGLLNKLFQKAFQVAKQVRTNTLIQRGSISVGSVAVDLAERIFTTLRDRNVMVLGAGDTSEKTARALMSRGARSIMVSNRSYDRAEALASELGGKAIHFDDWANSFSEVDIVISSTSAPHYVLDREKLAKLMPSRRQRSLLLIDIAVPRDLDPECQELENVYLYNIDDLQAIASDTRAKREKELENCNQIIRAHADDLMRVAMERRRRETGAS